MIYPSKAVPRVLFTKESARLLAIKSHEARKARAAAAHDRQVAIATLVAGPPQTGLEASSRAAKHSLSEELLGQLALLRKTPPDSHKQLGNTPDGEGRASLVKRIAETASLLYGWEQQRGNSIILVGLASQCDPDNAQPAPAIDVQSEIKPN